MARKSAARRNPPQQRARFINVEVSDETLAGLHLLKAAMGTAGQAEVIEKLVAIGVAIHLATRKG
jgi:hypothetical protein